MKKKTPKICFQSLYDSFRHAGYSEEVSRYMAETLNDLLED